MVALVGTIDLLHFSQQGIHFRQGKHPVGAYRAVASHGGQKLIAPAGQGLVRAEFPKFAQYVPRHFYHVAILDRVGHSPDNQCRGRGYRNFEPEFMQYAAVFLGGGDLQAVCLENCRDQQGLHRERTRVQRQLELFIQYMPLEC